MLKFSIAAPGFGKMAIGLQRFEAEVKDFRPFWNDYFGPRWRQLIDNTYTLGGPGWMPLSPRYRHWKEKKWPGLPVGVLSGALRESLTYPEDQYAIWRSGPMSLVVGTSVPHAMYQQMGTKKMPARSPIRLTPLFMTDVGRLLQQFGHDVVTRTLAGNG